MNIGDPSVHDGGVYKYAYGDAEPLPLPPSPSPLPEAIATPEFPQHMNEIKNEDNCNYNGGNGNDYEIKNDDDMDNNDGNGNDYESNNDNYSGNVNGNVNGNEGENVSEMLRGVEGGVEDGVEGGVDGGVEGYTKREELLLTLPREGVDGYTKREESLLTLPREVVDGYTKREESLLTLPPTSHGNVNNDSDDESLPYVPEGAVVPTIGPTVFPTFVVPAGGGKPRLVRPPKPPKRRPGRRRRADLRGYDPLVPLAADRHIAAAAVDPRASLPMAMRAAGFDDAASRNRTLQMRVRRVVRDYERAATAAPPDYDDLVERATDLHGRTLTNNSVSRSMIQAGFTTDASKDRTLQMRVRRKLKLRKLGLDDTGGGNREKRAGKRKRDANSMIPHVNPYAPFHIQHLLAKTDAALKAAGRDAGGSPDVARRVRKESKPTRYDADAEEPADGSHKPRKYFPPPTCDHLISSAAEVYVLASRHNPGASVVDAMRLAGFSTQASLNRTQQMRVRRRITDDKKAATAADVFLTVRAMNPDATLRDAMRLAGFEDPVQKMGDVRKRIGEAEKKRDRDEKLADLYKAGVIDKGSGGAGPKFVAAATAPGAKDPAPASAAPAAAPGAAAGAAAATGDGVTPPADDLEGTRAFLAKAQRAYANSVSKKLLRKQIDDACRRAAEKYVAANAKVYVKSARECCDEVASELGVRPSENAVQRMGRKLKGDGEAKEQRRKDQRRERDRRRKEEANGGEGATATDGGGGGEGIVESGIEELPFDDGPEGGVAMMHEL